VNSSVRPLPAHLPAVLAGRAGSLAPTGLAWLSESRWRLLVLVALPYCAVMSVIDIVSFSLFASGGAGAINPAALGLTPEVRAVHRVLMALVVLAAYRVALAIGWPKQGRRLTWLGHAVLGLTVALVSRPLFALSVHLVLDARVHWLRVFLPPNHGVKLWASMGLEFLLSYSFGLALLAGVQIAAALQRSELERADLRTAWTQARLQALRMQVNPHFLFNTFNTIATLLEVDPQPGRARMLVMSLSDLYRRTLVAAEREWMPLAEELALADDYLKIQAARFEGRLTYEIRVEVHLPTACASGSEMLARTQVPALLLQPLVENAATHGIADDRQSLRVWIAVVPERSSAGMPVLRIEVGNETDGDFASVRGAGIGLRNTGTRLLACYGPAAKLHVDTTKPGRYVATVTLPYSFDPPFDARVQP
jgi:histidine kinase